MLSLTSSLKDMSSVLSSCFFIVTSIFLSVIIESSYFIERCSDGSSLSEAHGGGWEGLGLDGGEPALIRLHKGGDRLSSSLS